MSMEDQGSTEKRLTRNNQYYDRFASEVNARSESRDFSEAFDRFLPHVLANAPVFDVGCGTGNHLREFRNRGVKAIGIEPSLAMRTIVGEQGLEALDTQYFTVRLGEGWKWDRWDHSDGDAARFIQLFSEKELVETTERSGFEIVHNWSEDSTWGRPSKWISIVALKSAVNHRKL